MSQRLTSEDWLRAGFRTLAEHGASALKAEVLARGLGTTKGSFYWHFKDVPTYRAEMLALWRARAVTDIINALADISDPRARLRALGAKAAAPAPEALGGLRAEAAIRAWGLADADVARAVAEVDAERIAYLRDLLKECSADPDHALLIYATYVGLDQIAATHISGTDGVLAAVIEMVLR